LDGEDEAGEGKRSVLRGPLTLWKKDNVEIRCFSLCIYLYLPSSLLKRYERLTSHPKFYEFIREPAPGFVRRIPMLEENDFCSKKIFTKKSKEEDQRNMFVFFLNV
jgi:hypothetical protein